MKIGLVCTTIGDGKFLEGYCKQAEAEGLKNDVTFYVIQDLVRSKELEDSLRKAAGIECSIVSPGVRIQDQFLKHIEFELIPWKSDNRRNVGYLMALEDGCEVIISIDDDNFCIPGSRFFAIHALAGQVDVQPVMLADWYNICKLVSVGRYYPRGYPYKHRYPIDYVAFIKSPVGGKVAVNEGLWKTDPDFDALTWLTYEGRPEPTHDGKSYFLGDETWSPINSQNTAVSREAMVANYFIPMGNVINGMRIDHHADIFTGYFLEACVKKMGQKIRFGTPIVDHIRNNHDYMEDLVKEYACIQMLEDLTEWLHEEKLDGTTYSDCYLSLAERMEDQCEKFKGKIWTTDAKSFIHRTAYCMRKWVKTYKLVCGGCQ